MKQTRETGLDTLLDLHGITYRLEKGYWVKFEAYRVTAASEQIPHGISYSLTLHDRNNTRVIGFDNAHCAIRFFWTVNPVLTGQEIRN